MTGLKDFFHKPTLDYRKWDILIFMLLTMLSLINKQTTIFYIIYFFWWNEFIRIIVDRIFLRKNDNVTISGSTMFDFGGAIFLMMIYFVFIVVFFAVIANWNNTEITIINMQILFFQNWFFNANLLFVLVERIYLHTIKSPMSIHFGSFTINMIVLHISIILGGIIMFFVVKRFPDVFTPDNLWGSILIIFPFLVLRTVAHYLSRSEN